MKRIVSAIGIVLMLGSVSTALAKKSVPTTGPSASYLLMANGEWGVQHDEAVTKAGGVVKFRHTLSGIGSAESSSPRFLHDVMKGGVFSRAGQDMEVQWLDPQERVAESELEAEAVTPGDETFINAQWNLRAIEASGAWDAGYTGKGVRVAILDGGIYSAHRDLDDNLDMTYSTSFVPGFNFNQDTGTFWHGTHVAGIVAAEDNGIGTIGVAPEATIIGVKVLHSGSGPFGQVIQGILYAADPISEGGAGADIINMSLGATFPRGGGNTGAGPLVAAMAKAVNYATSRNVLVVCSAGNSAIDFDHAGSLIHVPSQSGSGLAISATGPVGYAVGWPNGATNFRRPASYTNYGNSVVWVAAPGGDFVLPGEDLCTVPRVPIGSMITRCWVFDMVMSTVRGSGASTTTYSWSAGTSMSAPAASGVAALIKQRFPGISVGDLKNALANTADDEGANGHDPFYGRGFINARRAATEGGAAAQSRIALESRALGTGLQLAVSPQPARSGATFAFTLPAEGQARLELFDLAGRNVAVLFNGRATAGRNSVQWDGSGSDGHRLSPGAYFARLTANGVKTDRKLVLLSQ